MINQLYFILSIFIVGFSFSTLLFSGLKDQIRYLVSPLIGIAFYSFSVGALYCLNTSITIAKIYFILFLIWSLILFLNFKYQENDFKTVFTNIFINHFSLNTLGIFLIYTFLGFIFIHIGSPNVSPDSTQYEGVGRFLAQGGTIKDKIPELPFLINGRFLTIGAMHCINRLFGSYNLYSLYPLLTVWFSILLVAVLLKLSSGLSIKGIIFLIVSFLFALLFNKSFIYHGIRISSNGLTMIYFSLSIISLYVFTYEKNLYWLYLGSFLLGVASLVRIDMLIFSFIYFIIQSKIINNNYTAIKNSCLIFLSIALPWRLFTLHLIPMETWYINYTQVTFLIFVNISFTLFIMLASKLNINIQWLYKAGYIFIFILFIIFYFIDHSIIHLGYNLFIKTILFSEIWFSFTFAVAVIIFATPIILKYDKHFTIFSITITFYLALLFLVVGLSGYEKEDHSAIRMLVHIVPLVIMGLFVGLTKLLKSKTVSIA